MINEKQTRKYCYEDISLIENYELAINDKTQVWDIHHKVEDIMNCGKKELIAQGCYENRPAHELIFLTHGEHTSHNFKGKPLSKKQRIAIVNSNSTRVVSAATRKKMSIIQSKNCPGACKKGMHWWNNGIRNCRAFECPGDGWIPGCLPRKKKS